MDDGEVPAGADGRAVDGVDDSDGVDAVAGDLDAQPALWTGVELEAAVVCGGGEPALWPLP